MADHKLAIEKEERLICKLGKQLGINKKKRKEKKSFDILGLGDIYEIIESTENQINEAPTQPEKLKKSSKSSKNKVKIREDIYGRLIDKDGNVIDHPKIEKKFEYSTKKELDVRLLKRIRGLLNRLTSSNLVVISTQIEELLKQFSVNQLCSLVSKCLQDLIIHDTCLSSQKLISEMAMLITVLHCDFGEEIGSYFIHYFITQFDQLFDQMKDNKNQESKKIDNILILISYFYSYGLVESDLIFEILNKMVDNFSNKSIELIHLMLQMIGFGLRKDDPIGIKNLIIHVNLVSINHDCKDSRIKFMLETLKAIKNNNIYKLKNFNQDFPINYIDIQLLRNNLKNQVKTKSRPNSIPGKYEDILKSSRWWVKIGTLNENETDKSIKSKSKSEQYQNEQVIDKSDDLCNKLRLVTPLRRSLFKALINSQNFMDCCEKLIEIGKKQSDEVINVCLMVALKEKEFNLFYVHLLKRLSKIDRTFKLSLIFAIRNKIVNLKSLKLKERINLSTLISHLLKLDAIPITVLKVIEFSDLNEMYVIFLKEIIQSILREEEQELTKILSKIKSKDSFATALRLFIVCFLNSDYKQKLKFF